MRKKLEGSPSFKTIKNNSDAIKLLKLIRDFSYSIESDCNPFIAKFMAIKSFVNLKQSFHLTNNQYLEATTNNLKVLNHTGAVLGWNKNICNVIFKEYWIDATTAGSTEKASAKKPADDCFQAVAFFLHSEWLFLPIFDWQPVKFFHE